MELSFDRNDETCGGPTACLQWVAVIAERRKHKAELVGEDHSFGKDSVALRAIASGS